MSESVVNQPIEGRRLATPSGHYHDYPLRIFEVFYMALGIELHQMANIIFRSMDLSEKRRFAEVDRTESIGQIYRQKGSSLERVDVDWSIPQWSITEKLTEWEVYLQDECVLWGAFARGKLVGFCVYKPNLEEGTGQLALLHISSDYRRRGIGQRLAELLIAHAEIQGDRELYVTSSPTVSTVEMYKSLGFRPTDRPIPELIELEPYDIHLRLKLVCETR